MATFKVPPRIAFSEPISGSSLSVSQTTSLGSVAGPAVAAAGAGFASSAAKIAAPRRGSRRTANTMAVRIPFILALPSFLLIFGKSLRIERLANRFADEHDQNQGDGDGSERRQSQPQFVPVFREERLVDQLAPARGRRRQSIAKIIQRRQREDRADYGERRERHQGRQTIRQQVAEDDAQMRGAVGFRGQAIFL